MTNHHREAKNASEIAKLLRSRGRIIISAPPKCGRTYELLRYAEERYPNGRFIFVHVRKKDEKSLVTLHWRAANQISWIDTITARLLGKELDGKDVNEPTFVTPHHLFFPNEFVPIFADDWNLLPKAARRAILRRKLFIAAIGEIDNAAKEKVEDREED